MNIGLPFGNSQLTHKCDLLVTHNFRFNQCIDLQSYELIMNTIEGRNVMEVAMQHGFSFHTCDVDENR
jgi:hypothetical protein